MAKRDLNRFAQLLARLIAEHHCRDDAGNVLGVIGKADFCGEYRVPCDVIASPG